MITSISELNTLTNRGLGGQLGLTIADAGVSSCLATRSTITPDGAQVVRTKRCSLLGSYASVQCPHGRSTTHSVFSTRRAGSATRCGCSDSHVAGTAPVTFVE